MLNGARFYRGLEKRLVPCPICRGEHFDDLVADDRYGMGIKTVQCTNCGLVMTNPAPTPKALTSFYENDYRQFYRGTNVPSLALIRELEIDIRAAYIADVLEAEHLIGKECRILDAGCGEGSILRELGRRWPMIERVGIEPGRSYARFAQEYAGCAVVQTIDQALVGGEQTFNLVIANHVVEHVSDPVAFLERLARILADDGAIYVDVPDALAYKSLADLHIAHLFHFTPNTLSQAARRAGLVVASIERHHPPRHPASIRAVLRCGAHNTLLPDEQHRDGEVADRLRSIDRFAAYYRFRVGSIGRKIFRKATMLAQDLRRMSKKRVNQ